MTDRHARVTDLPGYLTPATVAEVPAFPNSYGFVWVPGGILFSLAVPGIAQDADGKLWANPRAPLMSARPSDDATWAAVAWTEDGLGVYVPPQTYSALARNRRTDNLVEGWVPVVEVLASAPGATERDG
jgi:hypothetical protein